MMEETLTQQPVTIPEDELPETDRSEEDPLNEAAQVRYLGAGDFELLKGEGGGLRLTLAGERSVLRVKARRCMPFTFPSRYISLRDNNDDEIGIIRDLAEIPRNYVRWIEDELEMRYLAPVITSIASIKRRYGGVEWTTTTDRGPKRFITRGIHDTLIEVDPGRHIVTDVDGNRYELLEKRLDQPSRERLDKMI